MYLTIDIGNTRTKAALWDSKGQVVSLKIWFTQTESGLDALIGGIEITGAIVSNVGNDKWKLAEGIRGKVKKLILLDSAKTPIPIKNRYATPQTLGHDRLAAACGAVALFPDKNCLVIDAGTCIKYDIVIAKGEFLGGAIAPGVSMRYASLQHFTAKLPLIVKTTGEVFEVTGTSTEGSIRSGVEVAAVFEMDGYIAHYLAHYGQLEVVITGGDTEILKRHSKFKIFAASNLVLLGLYHILRYNLTSDDL